MDEDVVSRVLLGLFLQPHIVVYPKNKPPPPPKFLHCFSEQGKNGELDDSLSFLDMPRKHIMASSNGLLLCCSDYYKENLNYVVCNPVTRKFNVIPQPHKVYKCVAITFICKRNGNYEILRVGVPKPRSTTYEIETFSSLNGKWKQSNLVSSLPFGLSVTNIPGFMLDDVIYWYGLPHSLVVYDRSKEETMINIQLLKLPEDGEVAWSFEMGLCEGNIHYATSTKSYVQVWVLSSGHKTSSDQWVLKYKVSLTEMNKDNPNTCIGPHSWISIYHIHPCNSHLIFLQTYHNYYWYDFETGKLHEVASKYTLCNHFLYELPQWISRL